MTAVEVISDVNHAAQDITSTMVHAVGDRVHEEARTTEATEARRKNRLVTLPLAELRGGRDTASETPLSKRKKGCDGHILQLRTSAIWICDRGFFCCDSTHVCLLVDQCRDIKKKHL